MENSTSVSYTHLDVYKRQEEGKTRALGWNLEGDWLDHTGYTGTFITVSYTHLDVYKRQPEFFSLLFIKNCGMGRKIVKKTKIEPNNCLLYTSRILYREMASLQVTECLF